MTTPSPPEMAGGHAIALIWAQAHGRVIGRQGRMPWHVPEDLARFKELTFGHTVLMGRATWESLPPAFRPLPGRRCLVLSRSPGLRLEGAEVVPGIADAIAVTRGELWVIGGGRVYDQTIGLARRLAVTQIDLDITGDVHAPVIGPEWQLAEASDWLTSRTGLRYRFEDYRRA